LRQGLRSTRQTKTARLHAQRQVVDS